MTRRPALLIAAVFAAGILSMPADPLPWLGVVTGTLVLGMIMSLFYRPMFVACLLGAVFLAGAWAGWNSALLPLDHIRGRLEALKGRSVTAVCRVVTPLEKKTKGLAPKRVFSCDLEQVDGLACSGRVIVNFFGSGQFIYGDRILLTGKFSRPFEFSSAARISYRAYLARQGIYALMHVKKGSPWRLLEPQHPSGWGGVLVGVRLHLQRVFEEHLSPGEAGLMTAMLLGPRGDIPEHVYDVFRKTGTAHIIAISGMNMTLTAFGVMFVLGLFSMPRFLRALLAVVILGFYSFMAGNGAPVARSALMAAVVILSFVIERETDALNSLGLAALVLLAADPGQLGDIGCQLSFVCVLSLLLLTPLILQPFEVLGWRQAHPFLWFLIESAAVTLAAFIGSAGILAYDFGYLTPVGLLVNLPVIPLMALVTALGAGVLGFGLWVPWLAGYFGLCLKILLNITVGALTLAGAAPVISWAEMPVWCVALYYLILIAVTVYFYHFRKDISPSFESRAFIDKPMPL